MDLRALALALIAFTLVLQGCRPRPEEAGQPELRATWKRKFRGEVVSLATDRSGAHLVVATMKSEKGRGDDHVYLLDDEGTILWQEALSQKIVKAVIAGNGSIVVAFLVDGGLRAWSTEGDVLWEVPCIGVPEISESGDLIACYNTGEETVGGAAVQAFNRNGQRLWSYDDASGIWDISLADGGDTIAAVTLAGRAVALNGEGRLLWREELGSLIASVAISPGQGKEIVVGTGIEGETLRVYDRKGVVLWSATVPGGADSIALSREGLSVVVGNNTILGQRVYVFDDQGKLSWKFQLDRPARQPVRVRISEAGQRVLATLEEDGQPLLLAWDRYGEVTARISLGSEVVDFETARDGSRLAVMTVEGKLLYYVF